MGTRPRSARLGRLLPAGPLARAALPVLARNELEDFGNGFYPAADRTMLLDGRNPFSAAVHPAGFLGADNPPVGRGTSLLP